MISWGSILYGAALSALAAALLVALVLRERNPRLLVTAALCAAAGPLAWNAILRDAHGIGFFVDAPVAIIPASWQDTGSGVFAFAVAAAVLGLGPLAGATGRRVTLVALACGLAAFLVDVYLY